MSTAENGSHAGSAMTGNRERVGNYYSVSFGKIVKSLGKTPPENMDGVTSRTNKNGDKVFEIVTDYIRGFITGAAMKEPPAEHPDWGRQMEITLEAEEGRDKCILNIPFDSAYGRGFLYAAPGISPGVAVEIEPYNYFSKKKGRDVMGLSLFQHGEQIPWYYTKAKPNGMPELKKTTFKGKTAWDNTDQLRFLEDKFSEFCQFLGGNATPGPEVGPEPDLDPSDNGEPDF